jgi:hypothetical protein
VITPRSFVAALSDVSLADVFNPYRDQCPIHDLKDAAARRRQNLEACLDNAFSVGADTIWIARDLGYRGGRRTGLPLTDEAHLSNAADLFGGVSLLQATKGLALAERTATVTWDLLDEIGRPVMLWNVFPFHPHGADDPMSNRCHKKSERATTWPFLIALIEMLRPKKLIAIGRDAGNALTGLDCRVETVRHPSYGGQAEFIDGIRRIYAMPDKRWQKTTATLPFAEFA